MPITSKIPKLAAARVQAYPAFSNKTIVLRQLVSEPGQRTIAQQRFNGNLAHWRRIILDLRNASGLLLSDYLSESDAYIQVCEHSKNLSAEKLVSTARCYLSREFWKKLERTRFRLDFPDAEAPRLIAECPDLLSTFYWMLAMDWDKGRAHLGCAHCGEFFHSKQKGAVYCDKKKCKERGRRSLDWARNSPKYNRRLKRRRLRRAMSRKRA